MKKLIISGGSGYLGRALAKYFSEKSCAVFILSRQKSHQDGEFIHYLQWDGKTLGSWAEEFEEADALINLAGRTVNCRYSEKNKKEIYDSRLESTAIVGKAILECKQRPKVWINSSSATIYRHALDRPMDEATGEFGKGFSVDVCQKWEKAFNEIEIPGIRKVALRSALVFGKGAGGAFNTFYYLIKLGLGGTMSTGNQYVSWIHMDDFLQSVEWILQHDELKGPVNCCAPNPLPNKEFMKILRKMCHQPIGVPSTRWMLELGAFFMRTETEIILKSRQVIPGKLLASGYPFKFPELSEAIKAIVQA